MESGIVALIAYGRITQAEGARMMGCHRAALTRLCDALSIDAKAARSRYLDKLSRQAEGIGSRPLTKHQLRLRVERAVMSATADTPTDT